MSSYRAVTVHWLHSREVWECHLVLLPAEKGRIISGVQEYYVVLLPAEKGRNVSLGAFTS